ncbi:MAG TPA: hypothetical protein VHK88_17145, partial [Aquihabitans sp.]|nr:hypothetical protein [Aquihabitans sp.]
MTVLVVVEGVVIAVLALLVFGLLRSHAEILKRLHELGAGLDSPSPAPTPQASAGPRTGRDFQVMPQVPSPPEREAFGGTADLVGLSANGDE